MTVSSGYAETPDYTPGERELLLEFAYEALAGFEHDERSTELPAREREILALQSDDEVPLPEWVIGLAESIGYTYS